MDVEKSTRNHVSYVFSREVILKDLLQQGIISQTEFERYDQLLYDRYHLDEDLVVPRPIISAPIPNVDITEKSSTPSEYISLTEEARKVNPSQPGYLVQSWLRDTSVISFLSHWELQNNPDFDVSGYQALVEELKSPSRTITAKKWIEATGAIGLQSKQGKNGGTYAHPEIACAFRAWLDPQHLYALIQAFLSGERLQGGIQ